MFDPLLWEDPNVDPFGGLDQPVNAAAEKPF